MIELDVALNKKISTNDLKNLVFEFGGEWSEKSDITSFSEGSLGKDVLVLVSYDEEDNAIWIDIGGDLEKGQVVADKFIAAAKAKWGESVPVAA